jgi:Transposase DDE domain
MWNSSLHRRNTMKKASDIFTVMKKHIHSENFLNICRISSNAFIRESILSCKVLFLFILNLLNKSIPKELISFCQNCDVKEVTRSAVTQARAKLSPKAFIELNDVLLKEFYNDNTFKTFHGLTILAVDGSTLELPINSLAILQKYGCATNQTTLEVPMSRISYLYDTMNGITWDAIMSPYVTSERDMVILHFERIKSLKIIDLRKNLVIFDRGYPSLALIVYFLKSDIKFLMRSNTQFLKEVNDVVNAGKPDTIIKIPLKRATRAAKAELKELYPDIDMNETITFRVVVVTLSTGENEILLTSLLDKQQYPHKVFLKLYFNRWGIEENYKFYKVQLEVENFSGKSCNIIEQDFHATVLAANAQALLAIEAEHELSCNKNSKQKKYDYKINKNISMDVLKDDFVSVLLDPDACLESFCTKTKNTIKRHLTPIRPERSYPRIRKHPNRKYHMNQR